MPPQKYEGMVVHATHYFDPDKVDEFLEHLRPAWEAAIAEPENLLFDVFVDPSVPGRVRLMEVWTKDQEWFMNVQLQKPYYKPYKDAIEPLWVKPLEFEIHERLKGWMAYKPEYLKDAKRT